MDEPTLRAVADRGFDALPPRLAGVLEKTATGGRTGDDDNVISQIGPEQPQTPADMAAILPGCGAAAQPGLPGMRDDLRSATGRRQGTWRGGTAVPDRRSRAQTLRRSRRAFCL
jgi:hypothetical protein